jgi:hypothetical protein
MTLEIVWHTRIIIDFFVTSKFFSYLTFHEKKYVDGENNNFKQAIADFLSKIKLNYTITTFEKAVASYILAT